MRASSNVLSNRLASPQGCAIAIIGECSADVARIESLLNPRALGEARIVYRGAMRGFAAHQGALAADLALAPIDGELDPEQCAQIEALTRRLKVVVIGEGGAAKSCGGLQAARAWAFVESAGLSAGALESAIFTLTRARESEERLLKSLGDQGAQLRRLAQAAAFFPTAVEKTNDAIWRLAGLAGMGAAASEAGEAVAQAFDVVDDLTMLNEEFAECLKMSPVTHFAANATDLNEVVEDFAQDCAASGVKNVSVQTASDPIAVKPAAAALRGLLDTLMRTWRETRQSSDKLELLTWDAGAEARLAIVLSNSPAAGDRAGQSPASVTMNNMFAALHPLAQACGASIEAGWAPNNLSDFAAMTICLAKPALASAASAALARLQGARPEDLSVTGLAG